MKLRTRVLLGFTMIFVVVILMAQPEGLFSKARPREV